MNLKPSLYDGHNLTLSFDMLLDMFSGFLSFSEDMSLSDKCVTFVGRCHFLAS